MTVLNVGGGGFMGSRLTARLAAEGEDVVAFDLDPPEDSGTVTGVRGDVTASDDVVEAIETYDPDTVVTLAYVLGAESDAAPERAVRVNCVGMDNVFRAASAAGVDRVVYTSSIGVYGHPDSHGDGPIAEDADSVAAYREYPLLFYSATKQLNEYQARLYDDRGETEFVAVRPSIVFGPGREGGLTEWASAIVANPLAGESVHLPFRPEQRLGLIYREDAVALLEALTTAPNVEYDAYNTGSITVTARELAEVVTDAFGGSVTFDRDADTLPLVAGVSHDRAAAEFGYAVTGLETAIADHAARLR